MRGTTLPRDVEAELKDNPRIQALVQALLECLHDEDLLWRVLRDLLTYEELEDVASRFAAAQLLLAGKSQPQVQRELGLAIATVNRVAQWVNGPFTTGGYATLYSRLNNQPPSESSA